MKGAVLLSILLLSILADRSYGQAPLVESPKGSFSGIVMTTPLGAVTEFLGVPYARSPVSTRRFAPPMAKDVLRQTFAATSYKPSCPQDKAALLLQGYPEAQVNSLSTSENCLYLNIFIPGDKPLAQRDSLAVMVWLPGRTLHAASSTLDNPEALAVIGNVIVVTVGYRVGVLGFYTSEGAVNGNLGLLDQNMALTWIQENIGSFAGDPRRVTLFGEGAGGRAVSLHVASAMSADLFQQAASLSGVDISQAMPTPADREEQSREFASAVGCDQATAAARLTCLRGKPVAALVEAGKEGSWGVVVDGAFLTDVPYTYWEQRTFNPVNYILGCNTDEGDAVFLSRVEDRDFLTDGIPQDALDPYLAMAQAHGYSTDESTQIGAGIRGAIIEEYFPDLGQTDDNLRSVLDMKRDAFCIAPAVKVALDIRSVDKKSFVYIMDYRPESLESVLDGYAVDMGVPFGLTSRYILANPDIDNDPALAAADRQVMRSMMALWSTFARNAVPVVYENNDFDQEPIEWPQYDASGNYLLISSAVNAQSVQQDPYPDAVAFWNQRLPDLQRRLEVNPNPTAAPVRTPAPTGPPPSVTTETSLPVVAEGCEDDRYYIFQPHILQILVFVLFGIALLLLMVALALVMLIYETRKKKSEE